MSQHKVAQTHPRRDRMCDNCERDPGLLRPCVRLSSPETSSSTAILRSELALTKKSLFYPPPLPQKPRDILHILQTNKTSVSPFSCNNNGVAEAVCGRDSDEQVGLSFDFDCTTQSSVHKVVNNNQNKVFLFFLKISCDFR